MTFYFSSTEKRDCFTLVKNTVINSLLLLHRTTSFKNIRKKPKHSIRRYSSDPLLTSITKCNNCSIITSSSIVKCVVCDGETEMMNIAQSPCKNCASLGLTPVEEPSSYNNANALYRKYDIMKCDRSQMCYCQHNKPKFISLSNIKSYSCSVAKKSNCDSTIDGEVPANIRTTASGINYTTDKNEITNLTRKYPWKLKPMPPNTTWTCKRCTLLNNPNILMCEACESPYSPDVNSNISPSVIIKVSLKF